MMHSLVTVFIPVLLYTIGVQSAPPHSGPCTKHKSPFSLRPVGLGAYKPQCTVFGWYQVIQSNPSTGYTWCVHPETGVKIEGSEVRPGENRKANCGKCLSDVLQHLSHGRVGPGFDPKPECDADGNYISLRYNPSTGYTYCVDVLTGEKLDGYASAPGAEPPHCPARQKRNTQGPCHQQLAAISGGAKPGRFTPQCTENGNYELVQHHGSTGYSWCVHPHTGAKIDGTEVGPTRGPDCPACVVLLSKSSEKKLVGTYNPQCNSNGLFEKVQFSASTGLGWCADPQTGERLGGQVPMHLGGPQCD